MCLYILTPVSHVQRRPHARSSGLERVSRYLEGLIRADPRLELLATGPLSVVNFRFRGTRRHSARALNNLNAQLVAEIQKRSIAIPSSYSIAGKNAIRVCNLNHRSDHRDFDALVAAAVSVGEELEKPLDRLRLRRARKKQA